MCIYLFGPLKGVSHIRDFMIKLRITPIIYKNWDKSNFYFNIKKLEKLAFTRIRFSNARYIYIYIYIYIYNIYIYIYIIIKLYK